MIVIKKGFLYLFGLFSLALIATPARAQREVLYAQYLSNPLTINPAYTGVREVFSMTGIFRRKWLGVQGFPVTQSFGADGSLAQGGLGLGLQALNDRMSPYSNTGIYGSLAYHIKLPSGGKVSFGGSGGINVLPVYNPGTGMGFNRALPSVGVGVHYQSDNFWAGVSKPELVNRPLSLSGSNSPIRYNRPLFVHVGGQMVPADNVVLLPSILITQQTDLPLGIDLNAKAWFYQKLGLGVSVRLNNSSLIATQSYVMGMAEYELSRNIRVGYTISSRTAENPNFPQRSVHELVFRFTPNPLLFSHR
ncbi:PorP/SprF family type IX secretion system membrane protein [Tellurirhabdus bombi]|uniref:PorP/SprF family type IX secretion system membrane protein n=1 Tax=Tellurirhabdus bombi TaxID=2907205 RepID=UPI001F2E588C|nr:PorP/SprF family type IX secretion system membrane protein [Tellurirhabdus bombi]